MDYKEHFYYCLPHLSPWLEQGWQRRFIGDERMVEEAKETYLALGYEVKILPLALDSLPESGRSCSLAKRKSFVLLVRKKKT